MRTVLIVDDEKNIRQSLSSTFMLEGYRVLDAENGAAALGILDRGGVDLIVSDLQMPGMDGLALLQALRERGDETPLVFLTAHGTIERAVQAVQLGAFDFIEKPPHADKMLLAAANALRQADLIEENRDLRSAENAQFDMIGNSPAMLELYETIRRAAPTQARVLILGENGSGKELIARALHRESNRAEGPFVRVNCAAIPKDLFESELFGHEKGAFTGATSRRRGKMVRAHGGTLFLDEIGEIPVELQSKLLRALESGEVEPVGAERETRVDIRLIAATNRNLDEAIRAGTFRQDLYYRLQVVTLTAPPLRERREDIPALFEHFLELSHRENNLPRKRIESNALERLKRHDFPGNVRELRNLAERLTILAPGDCIGLDDLSRDLLAAVGSDGGVSSDGAPELQIGESLKEAMSRCERGAILAALERNQGKMAATARDLGLERSHLYKKLRALGIERGD